MLVAEPQKLSITAKPCLFVQSKAAIADVSSIDPQNSSGYDSGTGSDSDKIAHTVP